MPWQILNVLAEARTVALVDWPSRDLVENLLRSGREVWVKGGSEDTDWTRRQMRDGAVVAIATRAPPERVDLLYVFRPMAELATLFALATRLGAHTFWYQSGLNADAHASARGCWLSADDVRTIERMADAAKVRLVHDVYLGEAVIGLSS